MVLLFHILMNVSQLEIVYYEPDARYVGWDLAIAQNGIELLEGNIPPGEDITQIASGCGLWYKMQAWK